MVLNLELGGGLVTWALTRCPLGLLTCCWADLWLLSPVNSYSSTVVLWRVPEVLLVSGHWDMWICDQIMQCRCPAEAVSTSPSSPRAQLSPSPRPHHYQALVTSSSHMTASYIIPSHTANHTAEHRVFHEPSLPNLQSMPHSIQDPSVRAKRGARK